MESTHEEVFTRCIVFGVIMILSGCVNSEKSATVNNEFIDKKDYNFQKYTVISRMYSDLVINRYDKEKDDLDYLYIYSDEELKKTITLARKNINNTSKSLDSMKNCKKSILVLDLIPSKSYGLEEILEIDHKTLNNGYVRSRMLVKGYEKIDSYNFGTFKDFSLDCEDSGCVITDVFDSEGSSAKQLVHKFC